MRIGIYFLNKCEHSPFTTYSFRQVISVLNRSNYFCPSNPTTASASSNLVTAFASSNLLIEEGLVSAQGLICHMQSNTFGDFELLRDLAESKMRPFSCSCLGAEKNLK